MCRLLAFTSLERKSFYDVVGSEFENFVALSAEHKDGWGIGHDGEVIKDIKAAKESDLLAQTGQSLETSGALFHLRLASKGITVDIDNNHPFTYGTTTFVSGRISVPLRPARDERSGSRSSSRLWNVCVCVYSSYVFGCTGVFMCL